MLSFENDYSAGAHPKLLQALCEENLVSQPGYGEDEYCRRAAEKIRAACAAPEAELRFLVGGTQTNQIVIASLLRSYEGVLSAVTGHVNGHEAGAIEYSGHKVLTLPQHEGKIDAKELRDWLETYFSDEAYEHMVRPGMVYLSYPTEYGSLYRRAELEAIAAVCREYHLPLFIDGARLGYGLMSREAELSLPELAALCDVFTIGGTKVGALCGEAVVFPKGNAPEHFTSIIKQHGGLLAKGRLLGLQFDALFTDGLYFAAAKNAIDKAERLKAIFQARGIPFFLASPTNQQFVVMPDELLPRLSEKLRFSVWEKADEGHTVLRFCTSWATTDADLDALEEILGAL
ncbi:MAG: aminotransferase class I/II-fold pyridoxal phosphate-dependent enzyme [Oscillospiraceae bacterium]|nr:aminotransferase class I/II-fold pyridoxal phosphate-dependent enzyme [Oscillospiraceae bacterium]